MLLFDLFYEYLLSQGIKEEQIICLELDQRRNYKYRNPILLCDYVDSIASTRKDEKRGYSVEVGVVTERKNDERIQREIDFVVNDGDRRIYIQSAYQMDTEQKAETELQSLKFTGDFFKKIVIRMDIPQNFYDNNGFYHCSLIDFLLGTTALF